MKKMNLLSKAEMKKVFGGTRELPPECLEVGAPCTGNVQCCSNNCTKDGSATTGATCHAAT